MNRADSPRSKIKRPAKKLAQKNKERTKVPEKFVNPVDSIPHMAAEVLLGSSAMGDTA